MSERVQNMEVRCDECSLYPQQRAGEGCRRGPPADAGSQAPLSGPSAGRRPSNLAQLAEDDLWTLRLSVSWGRRTAANATTEETRILLHCLLMPGWTLTWFSHHLWRILKEPEGTYEGIMGWNYEITFLGSHLMGSLGHFWVSMDSTHYPVVLDWYDNLSFLPFWEIEYLLSFKGQGEFVWWRNIHSYLGRSLELHVCLNVCLCNNVWMCL